MKNLGILAALLLSLLTSCTSSQRLFTSDASPSQNDEIRAKYFQPKDPILQAGDKITFSIWGHEDLSIGSVNSKFASNKETGKWLVLDDMGEVNLPKIGRVKLAGYNLKEANYLLEEKYGIHLKDPIINTRVVNHFVTILGEVNSPGKYALNNEKVNLVQLLGEAKGFTEYSDKQHIKILREVDHQTIELWINMTDIIAASDYNIILQSRDIIYVAPTDKKSGDDLLKRATPIAGIATAVAVLVSVLLK